MRGLELPERTEDFTADPVELFFDLTFVFAFSQIVALLLHDPNWTGVGEAALILLLLWMPWSQFTWSANAVSGNSRAVRVIFLIATVASVPMAAAVSTAFEGGGELFALPLAVIFLAALALMVVGLENGTAEFRSSLRYGLPSMVAMTIIVVGGFLDDAARVAVWIAGLIVWLGSTVIAGSGEWIVRSGHFAERHGLIIIIALGEVIVALGNAVVVQVRDEGAGLPATSVAALVASGVFAGLLWWSYFDRVGPALEHRGESLSDHDRGRYARDIYTYAHVTIVAGIILSAVALEELALHPERATPAVFRAMGAAGIALFYGGVAIAVLRAFRALAIERLVAIGAIGAVMFLATDIHGVWLLVLVDVVLLITLAIEHIRIERPGTPDPAPTGPVDDDAIRSGRARRAEA